MMKKAVPIALICLAQAGCSVIDTNPIYGDDGFIRDRSQDYEGAVESKMLEVPAELNSKMIVDQMAIPAVASVSSIKPNEFEVPRPIFFYPQSTSDRVDVERIDGERRVVVDEPPALVFATLKDFWRDNAVEIDRADKHTGYLETEWIVAQVEGEQSFVDRWLSKLNLASGSLNQRDKFRLDVQPVAGNPARTSIALEHARSFSADDDTQAVWDGEATQVAYKSEMMFEMLRYLSNAIESENVPTLSEHLQSKAPAKVMGRDSRGQPVLKVEGSVDDVWNKVHAALKTDRFDLGTIDRSQGIFYLTYVARVKAEQRRDVGFFEWLHSDRGDIKFGSTAIGSALGFGDNDSDQAQAIRYSSKTLEVQKDEEGKRLELPVDATEEEIRQARLKASDGFKIWVGDKVLYVFGDENANQGVYNKDQAAYEFTGRYQLRMTRTREGVYLVVWDENSFDAPVPIAEELLWDIKERI